MVAGRSSLVALHSRRVHVRRAAVSGRCLVRSYAGAGLAAHCPLFTPRLTHRDDTIPCLCAVQGPGGAAGQVQEEGLRGAGIPVQPVRLPGARYPTRLWLRPLCPDAQLAGTLTSFGTRSCSPAGISFEVSILDTINQGRIAKRCKCMRQRSTPCYG